jgi:hypothetical protein
LQSPVFRKILYLIAAAKFNSLNKSVNTKYTYKILATCLLASGIFSVRAQIKNPAQMEVFTPEPKVVTTGRAFVDPPSDAIVLFDGSNLNAWVSQKDTTKAAQWDVHDGVVTVRKSAGDIETKQHFTDYQLHVEWQVPADISGEGQARGNSGIYLAVLPNGTFYELQVLDSYKNKTYINGMAGSIYLQYVPLANPTRKPGEWQTYDIVWIAPRFNDDGSLKSPAKATVFFNGIIVENDVALTGFTWFPGQHYTKHGPEPIGLQAHGDLSKPISYRNIWVREL